VRVGFTSGSVRLRRPTYASRASQHRPVNPDPLVIPWQGCQLRVRHDDQRITPYSSQAARIRSAVELASDVEGLRLVLASTMGDRYRVRVEGDVIGLWRR